MLCSIIKSPIVRLSTLRNSKKLDMLKPRILAAEMLKRRVEDKAKKPSAPLNNADITILGSDDLGFRPCIIVNSEGNSYMFNCGSGTQRMCFTNKIRVHKVENIFITNRSWENISGIFGFSLTLQDMGCPALHIQATENISGLFDAANSFMFFNTGMVCSAKRAQEYSDHSISIVPIPIDPCGKKDTIDCGDRSETDDSKRAKFSPKLISYLCTLPDLPGALDPIKCKELKVPVGPLLGKLKSGLDVTLADGRVIKSEEVCSPKVRGHKFLIVDCPDAHYIELLVTNDQLEKARNLRVRVDEHETDFVIHLTPLEIVQTSRYQRWLKGFPDDCKHFLVSNTEPKVANFVECYRFQYLLNQLDDKIFPPLHLTDNFKRKSENEIATSKKQLDMPADYQKDMEEAMGPTYKLVNEIDKLEKVTAINSFDKISMRPKRTLENLDIENNMAILLEEAKLNPHYQDELDRLKKLQASLPEAKDHEPELVFLGTGSALPSKLRNTSCILMNFKYPRNASVIFDCGEDTYGQMLRHYGPMETVRILKQLDMIYISHQHADHHVGLIDILRQRSKLTQRRAILLLPPNIDQLLTYHNDNFEDLRDTYKVYQTKYLKSSTKLDHDTPITASIKQTICDDLEGLLDRLDVVAVDHCINSVAATFHFNIGHPEMNKFTVAYSGDARPSEDFATIGKNCDLLVHEATFDDRSMPDALAKKHCTTSEAIKVGKDMNAKFTILTHFSQRCPKIPYFTDDFDDKVGFAFDNLSLKCPTHFGRLPIMKPMLSLVFKKSLDEIDLKYFKSELRSRAIEQALKSK